MTGNTVVDAVKQLEPTLNSKVLDGLSLEKQGYVLVTAHRSENVDVEEKCRSMVVAITSIDYPIVYPMHPRTLGFFQRFGLLDKLKRSKNVKLTNPLGYLDFLSLLKHSRLVLTDSGGLQEEAVLLHVPCVTMRNNTERQETVESGANILVGTDAARIVSTVNSILSDGKLEKKMRSVESPYGDGTAGKRIVAILEDSVGRGLKVRSSNFIKSALDRSRKA
jgi:UDP-N-acetylglucosamine 2-epimerase (non-hydrolysing)